MEVQYTIRSVFIVKIKDKLRQLHQRDIRRVISGLERKRKDYLDVKVMDWVVVGQNEQLTI